MELNSKRVSVQRDHFCYILLGRMGTTRGTNDDKQFAQGAFQLHSTVSHLTWFFLAEERP